MSENWRILVALGLTMVVLVGWNLLFPPQQQPTQQGQNQTAPAQVQNEQGTAPSPEQPAPETEKTVNAAEEPLPSSAFQAKAGQSLTVDTPRYKAVINSKGGVAEHFWLKNYKKTIEQGARPIDLVSAESMGKAPMGLCGMQNPPGSRPAGP